MNFSLPLRLQVTLILAIAFFFIIVLYLLKKRRLNLKYTLLWILTGVVMLVFVLFPGILRAIASLFGIQTVMNTLYLMLLAFILVLLMMLTSIVSKQTERIGTLAQNNAFLEERVRELEKEINSNMPDNTQDMQTVKRGGEERKDGNLHASDDA